MLLKRPDIGNIIRQDLARAEAAIRHAEDGKFAVHEPTFFHFRGERAAYQRILSLLEMEEAAVPSVVKIKREVTINIPWKLLALVPLGAILYSWSVTS